MFEGCKAEYTLGKGGRLTNTTSAALKLDDSAVTPPPLPKTWGFNYDRTYPIFSAGGEGDTCQMNLADIMALPGDAAMTAAVDAHLHADFAEMKSMNGTAVRLYASLDSILTSPTAVNETALAALAHVVSIAEAEGLLVDLTGANVMRNPPGGPEPSFWPFPAWLANATDAELRTAQKTFWTACATQFKGSAAILDFVSICPQHLATAATKSRC